MHILKPFYRAFILGLTLIMGALLLSACVHQEPTEETDNEASESQAFEKQYAVTYNDEFGTIKTAEIPLSALDDFRPEAISKNGRNYEFLRWETEIDEEKACVRASAVYNPVLDRTGTEINLREAEACSNHYFNPEEMNKILVVYVSFTDGHTIDRTEFETLFTGDYLGEDILRSVGAYYKANSYGRELLHFNFLYYDCAMTSDEAWHYVNDEDQYGNFTGNDFFFDIFDGFRDSGHHDFEKLDSDGDGYVDLALFVFGEDTGKTFENRMIYGSAAGTSGRKADITNPNLSQYVKVCYERISEEIIGGQSQTGIRTLLHEVGHAFGIADYYDFYLYDDTLISPVGNFDMHEAGLGDLNPFSRFAVGWLHPYIITEDIDKVTVTLHCSSTCDEAILIPTSAGWNGTAFDEYLLIDVMAPQGATGFDWTGVREYEDLYEGPAHPNGGVRIYHVDARLVEYPWNAGTGASPRAVETLSKEALKSMNVGFRFYNTNGLDPLIEGDSRYYHLLEIVPRDGSSKYRVSTPTCCTLFTFFNTKDLFGAGDVFDPTQPQECFTNGDKMNNGAYLNYMVRIDTYDEESGVAIVTVTKVRDEATPTE